MVLIVRLPTADDGTKLGIDDYLQIHSVEDFEKLPRLAPDIEPPLEVAVSSLNQDIEKPERNRILGRILDEEHDPGETERLFKIASARTGISLRALRDSAKEAAAQIQAKRRELEASQSLSAEQQAEAAQKREEDRRARVEAIIQGAQKRVTLRAQSASDGELGYIACFGEAGSVFVCTAGVMAVTDLPENYHLTEPPPDVSPMSGDAIRRFQSGDVVSLIKVFKDIRRFIRQRVIFSHSSVPTLLTLWLMATYSYALVNFFGYIWLTSLGPGCAKSLVAKLLSMIAFNSTSPLIDPTPATVFRDIEANGSTFILDEVELLDPETKGALLSILNGGFERGATVPRMVPSGDGWVTKKFSVYGPKVIAGINQIPRPLQTRSFRIEMRKKKESEKVESFAPDTFAKNAAKWRDDLAILSLRNSKRIADIYDQRDDLVPKKSKGGTIAFDDRLRDIFAPLYVMAHLIDEEAGEPIAVPQLYKFFKLQARTRDSEGPGDYVIAAHALYRRAEGHWDADEKFLIKTWEARALWTEAEIDWAATESAKAKSLLRKLGGHNQLAWWKGKTQRGYVFNRTELQDLVERNPLSSTRTPGEKRKER